VVEKKRSDGLVERHSYSLLQVIAVPPHEGSGDPPLQLIQLRNPWGNDKEWNGDWSDKSPLWAERPDARDMCCFSDAPDGSFWMAYEDFTAIFTSVQVSAMTMPTERKKAAV